MASKLYKYLKVTDSARQDMIKTLNADGIPVNEDASFSTIASTLDSITKTRTDVSSYRPTITYYDNPEDDPEVWTPPSICKQIDEIWEGLKTYTHPTFGVTMYPVSIRVLQTDLETVAFKRASSYYACSGSDCKNPLADDVFVIHRHNSLSSSYAYDMIVDTHTNDGMVYTYNSKNHSSHTLDFTHTFDSSKDIIDDNGVHYKYVVLYSNDLTEMDSTQIGEAFGSRYLICGVFAGDAINIPYVIHAPIFTYYAYFSNTATKLQYFKYSDFHIKTTKEEYETLPEHSRLRGSDFLYQTEGSSRRLYNGSWPISLRRLEYDLEPHVTGAYMKPVYMYYTRVNTLIYHTELMNNSGVSNNSTIYMYQTLLPASLVYLKAFKIHPSVLAHENATNRTVQEKYKGLYNTYYNKLKYAQYTASTEEQEEYITLTEPMKVEKNDQYNFRYYSYPNLPMSVLYSIVKNIYHIKSFTGYDDKVIDTLIFPNLVEGYFYHPLGNLRDLGYDLVLPSVTGTFTSTYNNNQNYSFYGRNIYLPSLDNMLHNISCSASNTVYVPNLIEMNDNTLSVGSDTQHVVAPNLNLATANMSFVNTQYLHDITIPDDENVITNGLTFSSAKLLTLDCFVKLSKQAAPTETSKTISLHPRWWAHRFVDAEFDEAFQRFIDKGYSISWATTD